MPCARSMTDPACKLACRTLAGLHLPHTCREVVDKDASAVLDEVEAAIYLVAASILRGEGFSYDIPSRAKGNQVPGLGAALVSGHATAALTGHACMATAWLSCCTLCFHMPWFPDPRAVSHMSAGHFHAACTETLAQP